MSELPSVSVVVASFGRHEVLAQTIECLLALEPRATEIIVVDQTPNHPTEVTSRLASWHEEGRITWVRRACPSIPGAMNDGLTIAGSEIVLYVDDDVDPARDLVARHAGAYLTTSISAVAGQVLQPGENSLQLEGPAFAFRSSVPQDVSEVMGGNFSVRRDIAVSLGGFDENFVQVAYRFEAEFCHRLKSMGGRIRFVPEASLRHLRAAAGGVRSHGAHLRTIRPAHSVGEYYFWLTSATGLRSVRGMARRYGRSILTKHHVRRPWWIPATLVAEALGCVWALGLRLRGPKLLWNRGDLENRA